MPRIEIPPRYRGPTRGLESIEVEAATIRACIDAVEAQHPGFREQIFEPDGSVRRYARVFLNGDALDRPTAGDTAVGADDTIQILASAAGG